MPQSLALALKHTLKLRFFDVDLVIRCDSPRFIGLFDIMYGRFGIDMLTPAHSPPLECAVLTGLDPADAAPVLIVDDQVYPLHNSRLIEGYVYERIMQEVVMRVRKHMLIHAGTVAYRGQGIVLAGSAFHGKTTLVLELIRRGCGFLSDEMAALGCTDGYVYPFPRSLRVRPQTLELLGLSGLADRATNWLGKYILDIESIQPACLAQPTLLTHVVILRAPDAVSPVDMNMAEPAVTVRVDRVNADMLAAVRQIASVYDVQIDSAYGYPVLKVCSDQRMQTLAQIEAICQAYQIEVLTIFKQAEARPDFSGPARLQSIPRSQGVLELLQHFLGGQRSVLLQQDYQGNLTHLFMQLASLLSQAQCYRLDVGPLDTMADLVCDMAGVKGKKKE